MRYLIALFLTALVASAQVSWQTVSVYPGASPSGVSDNWTASGTTNSTLAGNALAANLPQVFNAQQYGWIPDGTDRTSAATNLLQIVVNAGGGTIYFPAATNTYRADGQLQIPTTGQTTNSYPMNVNIKLVGSAGGIDWWQSWGALPPSILDLRYTGTNGAKIQTIGIGTLAMRDLMLTCPQTFLDTNAMLHTVSTTLDIQGCTFVGSMCNAQDGIVLGGTTVANPATNTFKFQGYHTIISGNHFSGLHRGIAGYISVNSVDIVNNSWQHNSAGTSWAIEIDATAQPYFDAGVYIAGNLIEMDTFVYGIVLRNTRQCTMLGNSFWDGGASMLSCYMLTNNSTWNTIIPGYFDLTKTFISGEQASLDSTTILGSTGTSTNAVSQIALGARVIGNFATAGLTVTNRASMLAGLGIPNATNIYGTNSLSTIAVPLIGIDTNDIVQVSDATHDTTLNGQYVHIPGRLLADSAVITNTLTTSNLTVTTSGDFNAMNAGTLFLSNMVANVTPVFDGNTNLVPSTTTTNDLLSLHNMFTATGATVAGPILTTSTSTNGPAANEFATGNWVRSLLSSGTTMYGSTNADTGIGFTGDITNTTTWVGTIPASGSMAWTSSQLGVTTNFANLISTNTFLQLQGPLSMFVYMMSTGGNSASSYSVHANFYITYDKTNLTLLGSSGTQTLIHGASTNAYQFVASFPTVIATNSTGFYLLRRMVVDAKTGTGDNITFCVGTNTPSHISVTTPASVGANWVASGTTDSTLSGKATMGSAQINGAITLLSTNVLAAPTSATNYVANLAGLPVTFNMTTNMNFLHTTNGTANFTTWTSMARSFMVINNSGTNFPISWPATWHTVGTVGTPLTLTNGDFCAIAIEWRDSAGNTSQTNNWIGVAYKQY